MCGRYVQEATADQLAELFDAVLAFDPSRLALPTYNIAPSQPALVVRDRDGRREVAALQWGLVPFWARDSSVGQRMINARAETLGSRPAYRAAYRQRRCLVPATGFYEWQKRGRSKQPHLIRAANGRPFAFAGLWESWAGGGQGPLETFTIVTRDAAGPVRELHDRMPVIFEPDRAGPWLDPAGDAAALENLLAAPPAPELTATPVSQLVNNPRNDTPACVEPLSDDAPGSSLWDT